MVVVVVVVVVVVDVLLVVGEDVVVDVDVEDDADDVVAVVADVLVLVVVVVDVLDDDDVLVVVDVDVEDDVDDVVAVVVVTTIAGSSRPGARLVSVTEKVPLCQKQPLISTVARHASFHCCSEIRRAASASFCCWWRLM